MCFALGHVAPVFGQFSDTSAAGTQLHKVPVTLRDNTIWVQATVNGYPATLKIDTRATASVFATEVSHRPQLQRTRACPFSLRQGVNLTEAQSRDLLAQEGNANESKRLTLDESIGLPHMELSTDRNFGLKPPPARWVEQFYEAFWIVLDLIPT